MRAVALMKRLQAHGFEPSLYTYETIVWGFAQVSSSRDRVSGVRYKNDSFWRLCIAKNTAGDAGTKLSLSELAGPLFVIMAISTVWRVPSKLISLLAMQISSDFGSLLMLGIVCVCVCFVPLATFIVHIQTMHPKTHIMCDIRSTY